MKQNFVKYWARSFIFYKQGNYEKSITKESGLGFRQA